MEIQSLLQRAKELPSHINGELQPIYHFFSRDKLSGAYFTIFGESITPVSIFKDTERFRLFKRTYYLKSIPTRRADGNLIPMKEWETKLMYHKKYARTDIEVKDVTFDVVGLKRQTTKLGAAVLITNIKFII